MPVFLSCDWGTSKFRLRLVDAPARRILAEVVSAQGIASTFEHWKTSGEDRYTFFRNYLSLQLQLLQRQWNDRLTGVPLVISGMASSAIGMKELPYSRVPLRLRPEFLPVHAMPASHHFPHAILLISGVATGADVLRGEETILAGCASGHPFRRQLFILPGTHSKHAYVEHDMLVDFKTYMTGEVFRLLSNNSILANSIDPTGPGDNTSFVQGVEDAQSGSLLNNIFHVRTNQLFNRKDKADNYHYLSGLLIGEELKQVARQEIDAVHVVASQTLLQRYTTALTAINAGLTLYTADADAALITAQARVLQHYQYL